MQRAALFCLLAGLGTASAGYTAWAQSGKDGKDRRVIVLNERSSDMMRLYASRTTTDDWEENILVEAVPAGAQVSVNFDDGTGACLFDFRAIFRDDLQVHMWQFNVCREVYWRVTD